MRGKLDRMERESLEFFTAVYQGYHEYIKTMKQVVIIDASKPLVVVQAAICKELKHYLHNLNIVSHV